MNIVDLTGGLAGILTTIAFIPQVIKTWRSGSAEDISLFMFILFSTGVLLWLIYGVAIDSVPVIAANGVTLLLALSVLILKVRYMRIQRFRMKDAGQMEL